MKHKQINKKFSLFNKALSLTARCFFIAQKAKLSQLTYTQKTAIERQGIAAEEKEKAMSLTRKMLKAMGIEEEKIDQIIEEHAAVVDAIKEARDEYKEKAEKVDSLTKELEDARKNTGDEWQKKYEKEHEAFETYKNSQTEKETKQAKEAAYKALLNEAGISAKIHEKLLKIADLDGLEIDKDGKLKDADSIAETLKTDWAEFVEVKNQTGAKTPNPPITSGNAKTKEDILKIADTAERQKAIAENHELFGF